MSTKKEKPEEKSEVISVRLQKDEVKKLDYAAKRLSISRNKLVVLAIRSMLH